MGVASSSSILILRISELQSLEKMAARFVKPMMLLLVGLFVLVAFTSKAQAGTTEFLWQNKDYNSLYCMGHSEKVELDNNNVNNYQIRDDGWLYNWWANDISSYHCVCFEWHCLS